MLYLFSKHKYKSANKHDKIEIMKFVSYFCLSKSY